MRTKEQVRKIKGYNSYLLTAIRVVKKLIQDMERQEIEKRFPFRIQVERRELVLDIVKRIVLMIKDLKLLIHLTA